jgi:hypothetical protein
LPSLGAHSFEHGEVNLSDLNGTINNLDKVWVDTGKAVA